MKIIKNGKRNCGAFKFKCDKCGCKFEADVSDYEKVSDEIIKCNCPNCDNEVKKNLYEKLLKNLTRCSYRKFYSIGNIPLDFATFVYICMKEPDGTDPFAVILGILTLLFMVSNVVVNFVIDD